MELNLEIFLTFDAPILHPHRLIADLKLLAPLQIYVRILYFYYIYYQLLSL